MIHRTSLDSCHISQISHSFLSCFLHFHLLFAEPKGVGLMGDGAVLVSKAGTLDYPQKCSILRKARPESRDRGDPGIIWLWLAQLLVTGSQPMGSEIPSLPHFLSLKPSSWSTGLGDHFHFGLIFADLFLQLSSLCICNLVVVVGGAPFIWSGIAQCRETKGYYEILVKGKGLQGTCKMCEFCAL